MITYRIRSERVERVWDYAQYYDLAMYRQRVEICGHQYIQYVIEVPNTAINTRLVLEHGEYLEIVTKSQ